MRSTVSRSTSRLQVVSSPDNRLYARIDRPRLHALLDRAAGVPVVLIRAPAGYGKTVLLESWADDRSGSMSLTWESLTPEDADPLRFWSRLIAGIKRSTDDRTARRLGRIRLSREGPTEDVVSSLGGILVGISDPLLIVLDDFEHIDDQPLLRQLGRLLSILPSRVQVIFSSRTEPDIHLQRMMVEGRAVRFGVEDLAFTRDEAVELLGTHRVNLADQFVDVVMERTQGWSAGIRLIGIALERDPAPEDFVVGFSGENRAVADYLSEEVFGTLDVDLRRFVLETCVVDRLTGPIASSLYGGDEAEGQLVKLTRSNALFTDVDHHGQAFSFHPLFADFLRSELHRIDPELAYEQHRKAAALSSEDGTYEGVIAQAIAAKDAHLAEEFLSVGSFLDLFGAGEVIIDSRIWTLTHSESDDALLVLIEAARALAVGDLDGSTTRLVEASQMLDGQTSSDTYRARVVLTICQAIHATFSGDVERILAGVEQLEDLAGRATKEGVLLVPDLRSIVGGLQGAAALSDGEWDGAEALLTRGLVSARRAGRLFLELLSLSLLAAAAAGKGSPSVARSRGHEALALAGQYGLSSSPALVGAHFALAWAYYLRDELDEADACLARARRNQRAFKQSPPFAIGLALLAAAVARGRGDVEAGVAVLDGALEVGSGWSPAQEQWLAFGRAEALLATGDAQAAARSIADKVPSSLSQSAISAQVCLARGAEPEALGILEAALKSRNQDDVVGRAQCWCIKARALESHGDPRGATQALERALVVAEPEGVKRVFLDQGRAMKELLHNSLRLTHGPHRFARSLLERLTAPTARPSSILIDPLTDRELHVLRYLPSLLSASEIASELYVSLNTVKTHLRSIYRKLGVSTRREAVDQAKELSIL